MLKNQKLGTFKTKRQESDASFKWAGAIPTNIVIWSTYLFPAKSDICTLQYIIKRLPVLLSLYT